MFRYYSVKQSLNTVARGNQNLIIMIGLLVKLMSRVRMEGMFIFAIYLRWLFSRPDYSPGGESHLSLNMFSDEFKKEVKMNGQEVEVPPHQDSRNLFNILRQCLAFSIGSKQSSAIPRSLWDCLKYYRQRCGESQGYTPAKYEDNMSLHVTDQVFSRSLV